MCDCCQHGKDKPTIQVIKPEDVKKQAQAQPEETPQGR
jgi:hypothetical protein